MFAILDCIENGQKKKLCFASIEDAQRFKAFVNTYMEESGAGNGYNAYWVMFDTKIVEVSEIMDDFCTILNNDLIVHMLQAVIHSRTAGVGNSQGIIFNISELPPRQRPAKDDMFRTLYSQGATEKIEGRIIEDNGETFKVINCYDIDDKGKPKKNAKIITIPASHAMKINDWQKEHRSR
ncbi:MAG: hypothetical protein NTX82_07010 [Candidatus Parcubacteria bacterium]|nr:hypothetical protein [Candidatus Parcubacteria bacterium]